MSKNYVVFLHGWGKNIERREPLLELFRRLGYEVISPDLPGFGLCGEPTSAWGIFEYADWLTEFLDSQPLTEPVILIGHSFGGAVACAFTYKYPQRVRELVLIDASGVRIRGWQNLMLQRVTRGFKRVFGAESKINLYDAAKPWWYRLVGAGDYRVATPMMRQVLARVVEEDIRPFLPEIKTPTLIIWAKGDQVTPIDQAKEFERLIPRARLFLVDSLDHNFYYSQPDKVVEIYHNWQKEQAR